MRSAAAIRWAASKSLLRGGGGRVAVGGGTDIAIEAADIIILSNRLDAIPAAREISRHSYRKMLQNVTPAFLFNGIGVPLAATGLIHDAVPARCLGQRERPDRRP